MPWRTETGHHTFADCIVQEYQWSRSMTNILLQVSPRYWGGLGVREKVKLGYNQSGTRCCAFYMLTALVFPVAAILTHTPWVGVPLLELFIRAGLVGFAGLAIFWWVRRQGYHRPADAKVVSWETGFSSPLPGGPGCSGGFSRHLQDGSRGSSSPSR